MHKTSEVRQTYRTYIQVSGPGFDLEIPIDIDYKVKAYDPGRIYGPPEWCYPPDGGGVEVEVIKHAGDYFGYHLMSEVAAKLVDSAELGELSEEIKEDAKAWAETYEDLATEAKIEEMMGL